MEKKITVRDQFILVKQTMTSKSTKIITSMSKPSTDNFDYKYEILQLGKKCKEDIKVGDTPIFTQYVQFLSINIIEKSDRKMVALAIVHDNDIIAVEDKPEEELSDTTVEKLIV